MDTKCATKGKSCTLFNASKTRVPNGRSNYNTTLLHFGLHIIPTSNLDYHLVSVLRPQQNQAGPSFPFPGGTSLFSPPIETYRSKVKAISTRERVVDEVDFHQRLLSYSGHKQPIINFLARRFLLFFLGLSGDFLLLSGIGLRDIPPRLEFCS